MTMLFSSLPSISYGEVELDISPETPEIVETMKREIEVFIDPPMTGDFQVTGHSSQPYVKVNIYSQTGELIGYGEAGASGGFTAKLVRSLHKGEAIVVEAGLEDSTVQLDPISVESMPRKELRRMAYLEGLPNGNMYPKAFITRAEAAMLFARLNQGKMVPKAKHSPGYPDAKGAWYSDAVSIVTQIGFMKGYPDGKFHPNQLITRAEFVTIVARSESGESQGHPFSDVKHHWAEKEIGKAFSKGRIQGYPDGRFRPNQGLSRAEAIHILNNLFSRETDGYSFQGVIGMDRLNTYRDVRPDNWYYYDILDASNSHISYRRNRDSLKENWIEIY